MNPSSIHESAWTKLKRTLGLEKLTPVSQDFKSLLSKKRAEQQTFNYNDQEQWIQIPGYPHWTKSEKQLEPN